MQEILNLLNQMSPYLLLGFGIAGVMHTFVPGQLYSRYLSGRGLRSVLYAAALGIPLPLCSCGVLPTAMSLRREGASKGATTSFLIATPQTGVDSIAATYSLMGPAFAIVRPIAALVTALLGGMLVNLFDRGEAQESAPSIPSSEAGSGTSPSVKDKLLGALRYGYVDMMQDIGRWLLVGLVVAGIITVAVPDGFFASFAHRPLLGMLLVLVCAVPMYLCATGSIPIAVALMLKGMTPGAALVLLMAGPAVNVASLLVIRKVLGRRTLWLYLAAIVGGALTFALAIDHLLPRAWFTGSLTLLRTSCESSCHVHTPWFNLISSAVLLLLLAHALISRLRKPQASCSAGCDDGCTCHADTPSCCDGTCHADMPVEHTITVTGMKCNHCRASVIRAISSLPGTESVDADLASGHVTITGTVPKADVIRAVEALGFGVEE